MMIDAKNYSKQFDSSRMSVKEAFRCIRIYEETAKEIRQAFSREQERVYRVYAVDDRVLTDEETDFYNRKEVRSCMDVLRRAKLLACVTEEITRLRCLVSAALGEAGIAFPNTTEKPCAESGSLDDSITECMVKLSLCDRVKTKHFSRNAIHMSKSDKRKTYQYPVIQTSRLLVDREYAAKLAAHIKKKSKECAESEQKQMEQIFIDYVPKYDIHTEWHSWEADE